MAEIQDVIRQAKRGEAGPIYALIGAENFLLERAIGALRSATLTDSAAGLNDDVFHAKTANIQAVLSTARTLPMFASKRFVLVRELDGATASDLDALADYAERPSPSTCLVLVGEKLDKRTRLFRTIDKAGNVAEANPLKAGQVRAFLTQESKARGNTIREDAADAIVDAIGTDLAALDDALERLSLFVGAGNAIDVSAVEQCVARVRVDSIWSLVDAVGAKRAPVALRSAASLFSDREPPLRVLAMIARQVRTVAKMKDAVARGLAGPEAAKAAGAPPFKARELADSAAKFGAAELRAAFHTLAETDLALKGSRRPPETIVEESLLALSSALPPGSSMGAARERLRRARLKPR